MRQGRYVSGIKNGRLRHRKYHNSDQANSAAAQMDDAGVQGVIQVYGPKRGRRQFVQYAAAMPIAR